MLIDTRQHYDEAVLACAYHVWIDIAAPIGVVFAFVTKDSGLNRWWATRTASDPRPGGVLEFTWETDKPVTGQALFRQFEPPNKVVWEWTHSNGEALAHDGTDPRGMRWPALNIFELAMIDGKRTRVHLHDTGINPGAAYQGMRQATSEGWIQALNRLKTVAELHFRQRQLRKKDQ